MVASTDIEHIRLLSSTYTAELESKMARLDDVIGKAHWPSVGAFKESILRRHLADKVPRRYEVGTGFVLAIQDGRKLLSKQLDVVIWDSQEYGPLFRDGDFVILPPEAVAAAISVKKQLDATSLREALSNIDSLTQFLHLRPYPKRLFTAIFAFDIDPKLEFPTSLFNSIEKHYHDCTSPTLDDRLQWSADPAREWQAAWIDAIAVLPKGVIALFEAAVNDDPHISGFVAYQTASAIKDTYGFLERQLLSHLLARGPISTLRHDHPGAAGIIFSAPPVLWPNKCYTLIPYPMREITSLGGLDAAALKDFLDRLHKPRNSSVRKGRTKKPGAKKPGAKKRSTKKRGH